jgi:hypothetical protein
MDNEPKLLDRFYIIVEPWMYDTPKGRTKTYRIKATINGKDYALERMSEIPPYMNEIEWLTRISIDLARNIAAEIEKQ